MHDDEARERIRNRYGEHLAEKASTQLCHMFAGPAAATGGFAEEFAAMAETAARGGPPPLIVELTTPDGPAESAAEKADTATMDRASPLSRIQTALRELAGPGAEVRTRNPELYVVLRELLVRSVRDRAWQHAGPIRDELERLAHLSGLQASADATDVQATELCWLNGTLRARAHPRVLADVAADPAIRRIDLPSLLQAEVRTTTTTTGAVQYRQQHGHSGRGVVVAVLDSEVAAQHPALRGRIFHKQNYTREPWGNPGSHGTAVAGIIAANDALFSGIAPDAIIYNYKVLATNRYLNADDFGGAIALQNALEDGARIANCSWGVGPARNGSSREARACDNAWALGLTVVKSAGNGGPADSTLTTPADAEGLIVVGATDPQGLQVEEYSSRGPTPGGRQRPHVVAPGGSPHRAIETCQPGGGFGSVGHGTSFAAPHVAGMLALILEARPHLTPDEQRMLIMAMAQSLPGVATNVQGAGLVSLARVPPLPPGADVESPVT